MIFLLQIMSLYKEFVKRLTDGPDDYIGSVDGNPTVISVEMGLRTISWLFLGANHWSVLVALSNGQWVCIQFHTTGCMTADVFDCKRDAVLHTCPRTKHRVRISKYGPTNRTVYWSDIVTWIESKQGGSYMLGVRDCQNFCRKMISWLTGKWVGVWPIESTKVFSTQSTNSNKKHSILLIEKLKITLKIMKTGEINI
jgi:hypothetical protein